MLTFIERHFGNVDNDNEDIREYRVEHYNIYDLISLLSKVENIDELRELLRRIINIYNHYLELMNVGLPTTHVKPQKKLVMKMLSLIPNKDVIYEDLIREYKETCKLCHARHSNLNWLAFTIMKMDGYGLDFFGDVVGFAQSGKSTLTFDLIKRGLCFKAKTPYSDAIKKELTDIVSNFTAYNEKDNLDEKFKTHRNTYFWYDEGYLNADRRQSMQGQQIGLSHQININAKNHNKTFLLIQNSSDMDLRFLNKANVFILIKERGSAYVFVRASNYPIIKDYLGFEKFIKNPELLSNTATADFALEGLPSFCFKISWPNEDGDAVFQQYMKIKDQKRGSPAMVQAVKTVKIDPNYISPIAEELKLHDMRVELGLESDNI